MDFEKLLNDCEVLENSVSLVIENNASKKLELKLFQSSIMESIEENLNKLVDYDHQRLIELESLKSKKNNLNTELKQFSDINEKLSRIVSAAQKSNNERKSFKDDHTQIYISIAGVINQFEHSRADYLKIFEEIGLLKMNLQDDIQMVKDALKENKELNINLQRNDNMLRLLEQQNRQIEQQFDLILNQIPWEPLSDRYCQELRNSNQEIIRNLADVLLIQTNDVKELNESLELKKNRKLQILEELKNKLDNFVRKRDEAIMMSDSYRIQNNMTSRN